VIRLQIDDDGGVFARLVVHVVVLDLDGPAAFLDREFECAFMKCLRRQVKVKLFSQRRGEGVERVAEGRRESELGKGFEERSEGEGDGLVVENDVVEKGTIGMEEL